MTHSSSLDPQREESHDHTSNKTVMWLPCQKLDSKGSWKCMAVMYDGDLEQRVVDLLELACESGALLPVKLIVVENLELHVFLEVALSSSEFPAVESLWNNLPRENHDLPLAIAFSGVSEVLCGEFEYRFWDYARHVLVGVIEADLRLG